MSRSATINGLMLFVWCVAAIGIILPFAVGTSPLDALLLRVPGNEGNWWHVLIGLPFLLSLPMIWLHWQVLNSTPEPVLAVQRTLWVIILLSWLGTLLVEAPFLLHRAGTSELQRLAVIFSGIGVIVLSAVFLYKKRGKLPSTWSLMVGITAAYLANTILCLIIYGEAKFSGQPRSGWYVAVVIVPIILLELIRLLFKKDHAYKY